MGKMKKLIDSVLTLGKVALKSSFATGKARPRREGVLVIMGNGPSLADTITQKGEVLSSNDTLAVNFAANTEEFFRLKPNHYLIADPHFFNSEDPNVARLWQNISAADWGMTLHLPASARKSNIVSRLKEKGISIEFFNMTPGEGFDWLCHPLFRRGLAMPRPRNVLIPAIMEGIRMGYGEIIVVGADHTWPHTLYVDDRNRVVTVQPHFYKEDPAELDRIAEIYAGVHIHKVLESMVVAFRSYHQIRGYADKRGVSVYNATPGSLIDAFTRKQL